MYFDTKLSFSDNIVEIVKYVKRFKHAINYLRTEAKLSDSILFQVLCAMRNKFSYGLFWWPYVSDSSIKLLQRWWGNLCRSASGANKLVDRRIVFGAVGLSDIQNWIDFALFLRLLKRRRMFIVDHVKNPPHWSDPLACNDIEGETVKRSIRSSTILASKRSRALQVERNVDPLLRKIQSIIRRYNLREKGLFQAGVEVSLSWLRKVFGVFRDKVIWSRADRYRIFERDSIDKKLKIAKCSSYKKKKQGNA